MERFFLFCFRSCLKGEGDKEYYDVLELDPNSRVNAETVKKQYKKLSLTLHPDKLAQRGVEVTADHKHRFLKLKEAYDVLSDPKRRRLYDEYGESGLKLLESPAEVNHLELLKNFQRNRGDRTTLGLLIAFVFLCLFLLPVLFSLKSDGTLGRSAPWVAIWSPMWFVDLFLLLSGFLLLCDKERPETNEDGDEIPTEKVSLWEKAGNLLSTVLFVLIQLFVMIRMDNYTHWGWFVVFIPWYIYEGIEMLSLSKLCFFTTVTPPNHEHVNLNLEEGQEEDAFMARMNLETAYFEKLMEVNRAKKAFLVSVLRVWQALFLAYQLDSEAWNWGLVFLPIWLYLAVQYGSVLLFRAWASAKLNGLDAEGIMAGRESDPIVLVKFQQGNELLAFASLTCITQLIPLFMAIMLVCRLQNGSYSTFLIILPVFIILGCGCCIVFCGICCLSAIDMDSLEEEMTKASGQPKPAGDPEEGNANYEPPVQPIVMMPPAEETTYGTLGGLQQSPMVVVPAEVKRDEPISPAPAPAVHHAPTTIDVDID